MENSVCKISWKLVDNLLGNRRKSSTMVNVNPTIVILCLHYFGLILDNYLWRLPNIKPDGECVKFASISETLSNLLFWEE